MTEVKPNAMAEEGQAVVGDNIETHAAETRSTHSDSEVLAQTEEIEDSTIAVENATPAPSESTESFANEEENASDNLATAAAGSAHAASLDAPTEEASPESEAEKPQGFFRRRAQSNELKKVKAENEKLAEEAAIYRDRYLRLAAEMENFRKRTDRDFYSRVQSETARIIFAFLPLLDDLERCVNTKDDAREYEALLNGVRLIHQNFGKTLGDFGVAPMAAKDKEFDPNLHEALTEMPSAGKASGLVLEEHIKGYMLRDKVLRPAKVIVSK